MLSLLAFLVTIGILVVVHEYGHYLFARMFKVKVLTFSVGFGPKILSFKSKANEWRLSLIPFGGYVRMLDEREGIVAENEKHLAFNNKNPYQKILIAMAGPLFNLLFAILVYYLIALIGITQLKPVISRINPVLLQNTIKSNVTVPSQIIAIDGHHINTWDEADKQFNQAVIHKSGFNIQLLPEQSITIDSTILKQHFSKNAYLETIGMYPINYLPVISYIEPHSVADKSGLKVNDQIIAINSKNVANWFEIADAIKTSPGETLSLKIRRGKTDFSYQLVPESRKDNDGQIIGVLGIMPSPDLALLKQNSFTQKYNLIQAFGYAFNECYNVTWFNLYSVFQIITGQMSLYNLGGPISIAKAGGVAISDGIVHFAEFLALISIGLAIMNLLPIPVLDGGHILIYMIEITIGKQLSNNIQELIFKIGFLFVLGLSLFAIYNDMMRL
ncbi:MAG: rseP [Burkholderiales bacterium]|jgi:regulator of sigma E protease|nr:rseP [Burkholderiales bacterium]